MARNRKYQTAAVRFGPALKAFLLCLLIGGVGVGYVWQKQQISELDRQIRKREQRLAAAQGENDKLKMQLAMMHSQTYLEMRIKQLNLGLVQSLPSQVWRLPEPQPEAATGGREREYA